MNKGTWSILSAVLAILLVCLMMAFTSGCKKTPLEVGQVWQDKPWGDPFKDWSLAKRKILALRDGYVEYERVDELGFGCVNSMRERIFRAGDPKLLPVRRYPMSGVPIEVPAESILIEASITWPEPPEPNEPDIPPQWGKGDLSPEHIKFFGESNGSRLDFIQNQTIGRHSEIIKEMAIRILILEGADPNDVRLGGANG